MLRHNDTLQTLHVTENDCGNDAVATFKAALAENESLTDLDLLDNCVDIVKVEDKYLEGRHISDLEFTMLKDLNKIRPGEKREVISVLALGRRKKAANLER